jgi:hypothetical protein
MSARADVVTEESLYIARLFPNSTPAQADRVKERVDKVWDRAWETAYRQCTSFPPAPVPSDVDLIVGGDSPFQPWVRDAVRSLRNRATEAEQEVDDLKLAIERVMKLHSPTTDGSDLCAGCTESVGYEVAVRFSDCETLAALKGIEK